MKKEKTLKCPWCKKEIDYVIEWETVSLGTRMSFDGEYDYDGRELSDSYTFEGYGCPSCGSNILIEYGKKDGIIRKLTKHNIK